ncbi:MAG: hypothetical protein KA319_09830 [Ferruginibacter sp.]|nr:hypothetical protein [Ferruginibacter sp.]
MRYINTYVAIASIVLLNACAQGDKKAAETTSTTDGPNVIIDSTGIRNAGNTNSIPLATNQQTNQTLVTPQQVQQQAVVSSQQIQQQQIQQQVQQQMQQKMQQVVVPQQVPQQAQTTQASAHPQFSAEEFKKMQDDAKKRGVSLNPAHGQPNHRCDIYVGQPLDSKPVAGLSQPAQTATTTTIPQTVTATPQPVQVAPGMNPAHGQPGHRCDIEVGKPLNSKPLPTTPAATVATDSAKGGK